MPPDLPPPVPQTRPPAVLAGRTPPFRRFRLTEETRAGLVFTSPFTIGFLIFTLGPLLASLYLSFTAYDVLSPPVWIGLQNYQFMLTDDRFGKTLYNTL